MTREEIAHQVRENAIAAEKDLLVFVNKFLKTFDPRPSAALQPGYPHLRFKMYPYQEELALQVKEAIEKGFDVFIEKPRDMGVTYVVLAVMLWFWRYEPGSNFLLGSRKEAYVDNRYGNKDETDLSNKEESLFGKLDYMVSRLPDFMLPESFDNRKHNGYMKLMNPDLGNSFAGESSNPNFSRSGRFKAVLLDEFAFWENDKAAWGATADTTDCRIVITTPGIRPGTKAERLRFGKDGEKIKVIELDKHQDPRFTAEKEQKEKERRSDEDYAREILRSWSRSVKGRVYDEITSNKVVVGDFPYVFSWPAYVTWDFGLDGTAIQFWQKNMTNGKMRLVEAYETNNQPIQFFYPLFGQPIVSAKFSYTPEDLKTIRAFQSFKAAIHFGDPDVRKRAYQDEDTVTTRQQLEKIGIYVQTKPESNEFTTRRDRVKVMIAAGIEVNKTENTDQWLECVSNARYPERKDSSQTTTEIAKPIHDWTSHHRTATEYLAVNLDDGHYEDEAQYEETEVQDDSAELFDDEGFY